MASRLALIAIAVPGLALCACGGGSSTSSPTSTATVAGNGDPAAVRVIDAWANALRHGNVHAAAGYFALPSVAENGPILARIRTSADAVRFNESLPCGARLVRADSAGQFTTATFRLTERPGPGSCGPGVGTVAKTSFVIRDGKITQWRRVGAGGGGTSAPSSSA